MDLLCHEKLAPSVENTTSRARNNQRTDGDNTMATDPQIIPNLLTLEKATIPPFDYFETIQKDIQPYMRKVVTAWMMEVCDEQKCEEQVFPFAINLLDRFLCIQPIQRSHFQLLATATLLLATKIRQCNTLSVDILSAYTDRSVSGSQIRQWETTVLTTLDWNVYGITAFDYVYHILKRVPWGFENSHTKLHAYTLISVCSTELEFMRMPPSLLASSAICTAMRELKSPSAHLTLADICRLTLVNPIDVELTVRQIESVVTRETAQLQKTIQQTHTQSCKQGFEQSPTVRLPDDPDYNDVGKPKTPTDIQDVHF